MPATDAERTTAIEDLCRFLSACYYEPTEAFVEEKLFASMHAAASRLDPALGELAAGLEQAFAAQDLQTLLVDYTRLFLGPVTALAQPYASSWLTGEKTLMQDSTMDVLDLYAQGGFEIDESFQELPDHIAVQLEFLYLLNHKLHRALPEERQRLAELRQRFLRDHLGAWLAPFTQAMQAGAECTFYRDVARLTLAFVQLDQSRAAANP